MDKGVRLITTGIALTHQKRKEKILLINEDINSVMGSIRSSSDVDGMPHAGVVTDPVSQRVVRIEALTEVRDIEQERVNAVEWAEQCVRDRNSEEGAAMQLEAIWTVLTQDKQTVDKYIEEHPIFASGGAQRLKTRFLMDMAVYLRLTDY